MTFGIVLAVVIGAVFGYLGIPLITSDMAEVSSTTGIMMDVGLCMLLFFVGIDIGRQKTVIQDIKSLGYKAVVVPIFIAAGSIVGGIVAGMFLNLSWREAGAVGAGLGWYSLSSVLLMDYSSELSALAFISNVMREIIAILTIPLVAKYLGNIEAIAPPGATAMDTTLPIISKYTDGKTAILAFVSGTILTLLVPVLVPLFIH